MSIFDIYVPLVVIIFRILYGARSVKYLFENDASKRPVDWRH